MAMNVVDLWKETINARKSMRAAVVLSGEQRAKRRERAGSRTALAREVERAKVLLG